MLYRLPPPSSSHPHHHTSPHLITPDQASLVVEVEDIDVFKTALLESQAGRKGALAAAAGAGEPAALPATASVEKGA